MGKQGRALPARGYPRGERPGRPKQRAQGRREGGGSGVVKPSQAGGREAALAAHPVREATPDNMPQPDSTGWPGCEVSSPWKRLSEVLHRAQYSAVVHSVCPPI